MLPHAFTVDLEEWFHILDVQGVPGVAEWDRLESRVERGAEQLLEILDEAGVRATFFVLGWVAERHRALVRRLQAEGHEVASHGHEHHLAYAVGEARFRDDARRSRLCLEDIVGAPVVGYRAAGFSVTPGTPWVFDVLAEEGYRYDSSVFPARRAHGGFSTSRRRPFRVTGPRGGWVWEFPLPPATVGPLRVPFSGGGYLRLWPLGMLRRAHRGLTRRGIPVTYYIHPREVDPGQPRLRLPPVRRFKYYVNLGSTARKLRGVLRWSAQNGSFAPLRDRLALLDGRGLATTDAPLRLDAAGASSG